MAGSLGEATYVAEDADEEFVVVIKGLFLWSPARKAYVRVGWRKVRIASNFCQGARRDDRIASRSVISCGKMLSRSSML